MVIENQMTRIGRWVAEYLSAHDGQAYVTDILDAAANKGFAIATVKVVRRSMPVDAKRLGFGKGGKWYWALRPAK